MTGAAKLLQLRIDALEAEVADLRQRLGVVIDRATPVPSEEPGEGPVAMSGAWNWTEWRFVAGERGEGR